MKEKYGNKSPVMRFVHKYTGYIIASIILAIAIPIYLDYDSNTTFYQRWTCPMMAEYMAGNATAGDNPVYKELTPEKKFLFDKVWSNEC